MEATSLLQLIGIIQGQLCRPERRGAFGRSRENLRLERLKAAYSSLMIPERSEFLYRSLLKEGEKTSLLLEKDGYSKAAAEKLRKLLRRLEAALYDFKGSFRELGRYSRLFTVSAALFICLTPQFYGFIPPLLFIIPVFIGLSGMKKRNRTGFMMTLALLPMSLMTSVTWLRYIFVVALPAYESTSRYTALTWQVSQETAQLMIIIPGILSAVLAAVSTAAAYYGFRCRNMFI